MSVVGFNTKSKQEAVKEAKGVDLDNSPQVDNQTISGLQADTYQRLQVLGEAIMDKEFSTLPVEVKSNMLNDFAYYKSVADNI